MYLAMGARPRGPHPLNLRRLSSSRLLNSTLHARPWPQLKLKPQHPWKNRLPKMATGLRSTPAFSLLQNSLFSWCVRAYLSDSPCFIIVTELIVPLLSLAVNTSCTQLRRMSLLKFAMSPSCCCSCAYTRPLTSLLFLH
jgi:hypothetical protein